MHGPDHSHALKEIDGAALATVETAQQVAAIFNYVVTGNLLRS
ncbi:MAG: YtoQ family protein [Opitutae bacterium]